MISIPIARQLNNVVSVPQPHVRAKVLTDKGKPVRQERVLLLTADGTVLEKKTGEDGVVDFAVNTLALSEVFLVFPDVLEGWADSPIPVFDHTDFCSESPEPELAERHDWHKDQVDELLHPELKEADFYRQKDTAKHKLLAQPDASAPLVEIKLDGLTAEEKFRHFREFIEDHHAWYCASSANKYDAARHRFVLGAGAVCNQFANFFLGFWANHNSAFTPGASSTDFLRMMENDSQRDEKDKIYPYRGFADVAEAALAAPAGLNSKTWNDRKHRGMKSTDPKRAYTYIHIDDHAWDKPNQRFTKGLMDLLANFNVYSVSDGPDAKSINWDHHGGLLIKETDGALKKMAADGYKKSSGEYSKTPIEYKSTPDIRAKAEYYLRIWPLKPLRPGGYAGTGASGDYKTDDELAKLDTIAPHFEHALPRFLKWHGAANP